MGLLLRPFAALARTFRSFLLTLRNFVVLVTAVTALLFILDRLLLNDEDHPLDDLEI